MKITVITLFPKMIQSFFDESIIKRAQERKLVEIEIVNLRDFSKNNYKSVDDRPYGGGAGMVLMAEPIVSAIRNSKFEIRNSKLNEQIILTSPRGTVYNQTKAKKLAKLDHLILIAGHYEGVDERVRDFIDEEISLGDFVMTGGEITIAAIVDSVTRLLPGVLKKEEATIIESYFEVSINRIIEVVGADSMLLKLKEKGVHMAKLLEYPHYTRPEEFNSKRVPDILLSGNHAQIEKWRLKMAYEETLKRKPDLLEEEAKL